jgi:diguanylate cyclase (GGDEF)-like protein/PAS domain S-box-containing protein
MNTDALQHQLYRYAQDLQELMEQQSQLQQRYQMVLESVGRSVPETDVLSRTLIKNSTLFLVTDVQGTITQVSPGLQETFDFNGADLCGQYIDRLVAPAHVEGLRSVFAKFEKAIRLGGIEQRRLELCSPTPNGRTHDFDVLAMQVHKNGSTLIHWVLQVAAPGTNALDSQKAFFSATQGDVGILVTDPLGSIVAVSAAFSSIIGYRAADLLGENPRLFGSNRHDNTFFQNFWLELLEAGCWNGQLFNRRRNGQIFLSWQSVKMVEDAQGKVVSYVAAHADLSVRDSNSKKMVQLAYHDPLTGLANRRLFESQLEQHLTDARKDKTGLCVIFLGVDGLKSISEEFGYAIGDLVRRELGDRLSGLERSGLSVAQLSGEEFVLLLRGAETESEIEAIASTTLSKLAAPFLINQHQITVKSNMGCARYPQDGSDMLTLLKHADAAMYGAKRFNTDFCFYETGVVREGGV